MRSDFYTGRLGQYRGKTIVHSRMMHDDESLVIGDTLLVLGLAPVRGVPYTVPDVLERGYVLADVYGARRRHRQMSAVNLSEPVTRTMTRHHWYALQTAYWVAVAQAALAVLGWLARHV